MKLIFSVVTISLLARISLASIRIARTILSLFFTFVSNVISLKVPGATWTAAGLNEHIQAHGGGILEVDGVYYWVGENHLDGPAF
jgi:hypothetical protein